jgi:hypothetical protein
MTMPCRFASGILMRWWAGQSLQTQPWTYAALVPCSRSSRRAAVSAVSNFSDHSWSVLVSPHTLVQLLPCPRRLGYQPKEEPASHHAWCHIACRGGLAYRGDSVGLAGDVLAFL